MNATPPSDPLPTTTEEHLDIIWDHFQKGTINSTLLSSIEYIRLQDEDGGVGRVRRGYKGVDIG